MNTSHDKTVIPMKNVVEVILFALHYNETCKTLCYQAILQEKPKDVNLLPLPDTVARTSM